jgi:hypothetical protein
LNRLNLFTQLLADVYADQHEKEAADVGGVDVLETIELERNFLDGTEKMLTVYFGLCSANSG